MGAFDYFEPTTLEETKRLLFEYGGRARILAGGVDLIPRMRKSNMKVGYVINIQEVPGLEYIDVDVKQGLRFGAMVRLYSLEASKAIQNNYPILYDAIHQITSVQTKYMGTAVGNLCVGTPASDVATSLFALGAELKITSVKGERTEPIEKFYVDYHLTCLKQDEMITEVFIPYSQPGTGAAFLNLLRTHADIAKISAAAAIVVQNNICRGARIAIGAAAPTVFRATKGEAAIIGQKITPEVISKAAEIAAGETKPITDLRSTAEYRREMAKVLVRRVLEKATKM